VEAKLEKRWSPSQIADWLPTVVPEDPEMRVSHETIYMSLFVQARGGAAPGALSQPAPGSGPSLPDWGSPAERQGDHQRHGHDLRAAGRGRGPGRAWSLGGRSHLGQGQRSIGTLVERSTRYVVLVRLADGKSAPAVRKALAKRIVTLPTELRRSITWDQGKELAEHVRFNVDTGVQIYFCDPKSPCQRSLDTQQEPLAARIEREHQRTPASVLPQTQ